MARIAATCLMLLVLTSCAGLKHAMEYKDIKVQKGGGRIRMRCIYTIQLEFQKKFHLSIEQIPLNWSPRKGGGVEMMGYLYKLTGRG